MNDTENLVIMKRALSTAVDFHELTAAEESLLLDWLEELIEAAGAEEGFEEGEDDPDA